MRGEIYFMYFFVNSMSRVRKLEENIEIFDKDKSIGNDSLVGRKIRLGSFTFL